MALDQIGGPTEDAAVLRDLNLAVVVLLPRDMAQVGRQGNQRVPVAARPAAELLPRAKCERPVTRVVVPFGLARDDRSAGQVAFGVVVRMRFGRDEPFEDCGADSESFCGLDSGSFACASNETSENFPRASSPTFTFHAAVSSRL